MSCSDCNVEPCTCPDEPVMLQPKNVWVPVAWVGGIMAVVFMAGSWFVTFKQAPKDVSALAAEHKAFTSRAHDTHHEMEKNIGENSRQLTEVRTNQRHILQGINDLKAMMIRYSSRPRRRTSDGP